MTKNVQIAPRYVVQWEQLALSAGGDAALVERLILMARRLPPVAAAARDRRVGGDRVRCAFDLSPDDAREVERLALASGFRRAEWVRALVRARLYRQPQMTPEELRANTAARYALQRIASILAHGAQRAEPVDAPSLLAAWAEARAQLRALRAALAGNLAYWDGDDDAP